MPEIEARAQRVWNGPTTKWLVGVSIAVIGLLTSTLSGILIGRITGMEDAISTHRDLEGHPVVAERVTRIDEQQGIIRDDLKGLGQKFDALIRQQDRNTDLLERIDRKLGEGP